MHGRVIHIDMLSSLDCHIKNLFEFQGWANIFTIPMFSYYPLIRLFYANLHSPKPSELESLVMWIFIDRKNLDYMLGISCSGIMAPPMTGWPSDCDVSYDQVKHKIILDASKLIPPHIGLKDLPFESPVISHIMATTLLPRADSHSMLTLHDTFSVYCLISCIKVNLFSFIISTMTEDNFDLFSLPFGMLLTRIFEHQYFCLEDFSL